MKAFIYFLRKNSDNERENFNKYKVVIQRKKSINYYSRTVVFV